MNSSSFLSSCVCHIFFLGVLLECSVWMQRMSQNCRTLKSAWTSRTSVLSRYLNNACVLCPRCPYCLRTVSATSVLSAYSIRGLYAVSVLHPRLDVHPLKCHPYCVRDVRTLSLTILHPLLCAAVRGKFGPICPFAAPSVLILAHVNKITYCLRTLYDKFRPFSIRSDPQHPCVCVYQRQCCASLCDGFWRLSGEATENTFCLKRRQSQWHAAGTSEAET